MTFDNLEIAAKTFANYVIQQSRTRLTKDKKGKGALYSSLDKKITQDATGVIVRFFMEDYGSFVDKGVMGKDPSRLSPNAKITGQQAPNSPYKFGSGNYAGTWDAFLSKIKTWAQIKGVRFRQQKGTSKGGQFKAGNYDSIAYIIASNIYNRGLKGNEFFSVPYQRGIERYGDLFREALIKDLEQQNIK
jgi:hypothetical protein